MTSKEYLRRRWLDRRGYEVEEDLTPAGYESLQREWLARVGKSE